LSISASSPSLLHCPFRFNIKVSVWVFSLFYYLLHSEALVTKREALSHSWTRPFRTVQRARPGVSLFLVLLGISPLKTEAVLFLIYLLIFDAWSLDAGLVVDAVFVRVWVRVASSHLWCLFYHFSFGVSSLALN
jgi:hypothetical protein